MHCSHSNSGVAHSQLPTPVPRWRNSKPAASLLVENLFFALCKPPGDISHSLLVCPAYNLHHQHPFNTLHVAERPYSSTGNLHFSLDTLAVVQLAFVAVRLSLAQRNWISACEAGHVIFYTWLSFSLHAAFRLPLIRFTFLTTIFALFLCDGSGSPLKEAKLSCRFFFLSFSFFANDTTTTN